MRLVRTGASEKPSSIGILPGSFNPPTIAHLELVEAAQGRVDEIVCVVPAKLPHKEYFGATLEQRLEMLGLAKPESRYGIAVSERGLFIDIALELRAHCGPEPALYFLCGADAAERIVNWDYGEAGAIETMLDEFQLLVAARGKQYEPPRHLARRVHRLEIGEGHHSVSSSEVRQRIQGGEPWEHLVPPAIVPRVRQIYSADDAISKRR